MSVVFGVIGCGSISRFHFAGLAKAGARVRWVCDLSADTAKPWMEKTGAKYTADYREILADDEVNAVAVLTVSSTHRPICLAAIEAGKAVVCEKTLAEDPDDALAIVQAAKAKGTILYTAYMKRFIPAMAKAKELLAGMGTVISTSIRAYQPWGVPWNEVPSSNGFVYAAPGEVSTVRRRYGGGVLVCGGSHILDLVCFFLGRPKRVFGTMHHPRGTDVDLQAAALLQTDNGPVHYEALAHPLRQIGFLRDGWDERVEINAEGGRLEVYSAMWDQTDHKASMLVHYDNATGQSTEYRYRPGTPFEPELAHFCEQIAAGRQGPQAITTGYDVDELIAAIARSSAEGRAVDVEYRI